jgi:osmotically-inducible protein OsmY
MDGSRTEVGGDDDAIALQVREALAAEPNLSAATISAVAGRGQVTLYGSVRQDGEKSLAEDVAAAQPGVSRVRNFLGVDPDGQQKDQQRAEKLSKALFEDDEIDASEVQVSLSGPQAVLWGSVDNAEHKRKAERLARFDMGAMYVRNELNIKPAEAEAT